MKTRVGRGTTLRSALFLLALATAGWVDLAAAQPPWKAPPEPAIRPVLPKRGEADLDNNRVDDRIDHRLGRLRSELAHEANATRRARLQARIDAPVLVEIVFQQQVSQKQI